MRAADTMPPAAPALLPVLRLLRDWVQPVVPTAVRSFAAVSSFGCIQYNTTSFTTADSIGQSDFRLFLHGHLVVAASACAFGRERRECGALTRAYAVVEADCRLIHIGCVLGAFVLEGFQLFLDRRPFAFDFLQTR